MNTELSFFIPHPSCLIPSDIMAKEEESEVSLAINAPLNRKLRMGLVGGGGGFVGQIHAIAATLDNRAILMAGALSSDPAQGQGFSPRPRHPRRRAPMVRIRRCLPPESRLPADATHRLRYRSPPPTIRTSRSPRPLLAAGFDVVCDKPMTFDLTQAEELAPVVDNGAWFSPSCTAIPAIPWCVRPAIWSSLVTSEIKAICASLSTRLVCDRVGEQNAEAGCLAD